MHTELILYKFLFFFFTNPAPTEIYTLSLHDALPISSDIDVDIVVADGQLAINEVAVVFRKEAGDRDVRSEEHTSELQSHHDLVCRLLLEKKKKKKKHKNTKHYH